MSFNREDMIEALINDDIDSIMVSKNEFNDESYIDNILRVGHRGYEDYANAELMAELIERDMVGRLMKEAV